MPDLDADLIAGLKLAKSRKMFFAFILKGGSDGQLILSKVKIPAADVSEARKGGSGAPWLGTCSGPFNNMVFEVVKRPPTNLGAVIKKVVKRETGLTIVPDVQVAE